MVKSITSIEISPSWRLKYYIEPYSNKIPKHTILLRPTHKNNFIILEKQTEQRIEADGLITQGGYSLKMQTADCAPIIFYSKKHEKIGLLHAGFRNVNKYFIKKFVASLEFPISDYSVWIGPMICAKCYIHKHPLQIAKWLYFKKNYPQFIHSSKNNGLVIDLKSIIKYLIILSEIPEKNIFEINLCSNEDLNVSFHYNHKIGDRIATMLEKIKK